MPFGACPAKSISACEKDARRLFTIPKGTRLTLDALLARVAFGGDVMNAIRNMAWIVVAAALVALVVLSRDWSYAKQAVGVLDSQAEASARIGS